MKAVVDVPESELCLQVFEVDAAAWLSKEAVRSALYGTPEELATNSTTIITTTTNITAIATPPIATSQEPQTFEAFEVEMTTYISPVVGANNLVVDAEPNPDTITTTATNVITKSTTASTFKRVEYRINRLRSFLLPDGTVPKERLSTGCRFALREWLASTEHDNK